MLRECRRVLVPGGAIAFTTIELAPGLTRYQRRRLADAAPRAVATRRPYSDLLASAGFDGIGARDVSQEYLATTIAWLEHSEPVRSDLETVDGADVVAERFDGWRSAAAAVAAGRLRRTLYWARRPT